MAILQLGALADGGAFTTVAKEFLKCVCIVKNRALSMLLKGYLTVEKVAKQLGLSEYRVRELIREKQIRATKIGQWRVKPDELERFIKSRSNL